LDDWNERVAARGDAVDALLELVQTHDPLQLIPSVTVLTNMSTWSEGTRIDDGNETFTWDAKIEYLGGLVLAGPSGDADVPVEVTERAIELIAAVFDATHAELLLRSVGDEGVTDNPALDLASYQMQVEDLRDRMRGYVAHLEEINDAVFEPRRPMFLDALGFCPSDIVRLVSRHNGWVNAEIDRVFPLMATSRQSGDDEVFVEAAASFKQALDATCLWTPELLVETTGLPRDQIEAMLTSMSTEFGSQPDFRVPGDENLLRKWPFIRVDDGFLIPTPWAPAHFAHDWLLAHLETNPNPRLRDAYFRGRSDGAERLVRSAVAVIFGESVVHANVHYDGADGHGEVDCLVGGGTPTLIEVKSQLVTEAGRRGARSRLMRVTADILERSNDQTSRAAAYIAAGGRRFAFTEGGEQRRVLDDEVAIPVQIVVSFESIDPLAISMATLLESEEPPRMWVTDLPDFLVVRDFLGDPGPFLDYARARSDPGRPAAYMESDAVITYLEERLRSESPEPDDDDDVPVLPYRSGPINDYYTKTELGFPAERLGLGIPDDVRQALRDAGMRDNSLTWWRVASAILDMDRSDWARWKHFHRRNRNDRLFTAPAGDVGIIISSEASVAEIVAGDPPVLKLPSSS
jgi:hypothetical protein